VIDFEERVQRRLAELKDWDPDKHPRASAGSSEGGQFVSAGGIAPIYHHETMREMLPESGLGSVRTQSVNVTNPKRADDYHAVLDIFDRKRRGDFVQASSPWVDHFFHKGERGWAHIATVSNSSGQRLNFNRLVPDSIAARLESGKEWDPDKHPRNPAGSTDGGQFTSGAEGGVATATRPEKNGDMWRRNSEQRMVAVLNDRQGYFPSLELLNAKPEYGGITPEEYQRILAVHDAAVAPPGQGNADYISQHAAAFRQAGGTVQSMTPSRAQDAQNFFGAARDQLEDTETSKPKTGAFYAAQACDDYRTYPEEGVGFIAYSKEGVPVAAVSGEQQGGDFHVGFLGSTGAVGGAGSALQEEILSYAGRKGLGVTSLIGAGSTPFHLDIGRRLGSDRGSVISNWTNDDVQWLNAHVH
jgi:hypothetical protein